MINTKEGAKRKEIAITASLLVKITEEQGIYFAIAFLADSQYSMKEVRKLILPMLEDERGARK